MSITTRRQLLKVCGSALTAYVAEVSADRREYESVSALKSATTPRGNFPKTLVISVLGRSTPNDGGDFDCCWNATSTETADDISVFNPNGNAGPGRYIRQNRWRAKAELAGADPNGAKDSRAAFAELLAARGVREIVCRAGRYTFSANNILVSDGKRISGIKGAMGTVFCYFPAAPTADADTIGLFNAYGVTDFSCRNIAYISNSEVNSLVDATNSTRVVIENIISTNATPIVSGVHSTYSNPQTAYQTEVRNCSGSSLLPALKRAFILAKYTDGFRVIGGSADGFLHGLQFWGGDQRDTGANPLTAARKCTNLSVTNFSAKSMLEGGLWGSMGKDCTFINCYSEDCGDVNFDFEASISCRATNCRAKQSTANNGCFTTFFQCKDILFDSNTAEVAHPQRIHHINNDSQDPSRVKDVVFRNNTARCTSGVAVIDGDAAYNWTISTNDLTNVAISNRENNMSNALIERNTLKFRNEMGSKPFSAICAMSPILLPDKPTVVSNNKLICLAAPPSNSIGILLVHQAYSSHSTVIASGNWIDGAFTVHIATEESSGNLVGEFVIGGNMIASKAPVYIRKEGAPHAKSTVSLSQNKCFDASGNTIPWAPPNSAPQ